MAVSYSVQEGDAWEDIAAANGIPVTWLQQANGLDPTTTDVAPLAGGEIITIPDPPPTACVAPSNNNTVAVPAPPPPPLAAFGPKIELVVRSYAPFTGFGTPVDEVAFEGDARTYSTDSGARARITSIATIDTTTYAVTFSSFSNESAFPALPFKYDEYSYWPEIDPHLQATATATPHVTGTSHVDSSGRLTIVMSHAGSVPIPEMAIPDVFPDRVTGVLRAGARKVIPDIDVHTTFRLDVRDQTLIVQTSMVGDGFPNVEAFARFGDGRAVLLHHYEVFSSNLPWQRGFWEGKFTGPTTSLLFDSERSMGATTTRVPEQ